MLKSYSVYYNVTRFEDEHLPLTALCEFFQHSEKYVLSRKANLWTVDSEEFLYLYNIEHLTLADVEKYCAWVWEEGQKRVNIGPGHMNSNIVALFVCGSCDEDARRALKKYRLHKSFKFSLHGWMDLHTVLVEVDNDRIEGNSISRSAVKLLKKILK
jgi:hypothetical protein